ncbi:hydrolase [Kitasatospora paracochleata]|uniref:Nicotinamidase-related amidase n=1 Tax=Kitasatospora paracochleata TaxID=58354 RepID=A0ABT1IUC8_9ACTN|nr:isochorismatase family protein [Kitasatospora paracochleata]MCP2308739.1 nicotinamidase-related amidase [Kitasatospora paracochleata]
MTAFDPARTALVLIDLMDRIVGLPVEPRSGAEVVAASVALAQRFRAAGAPVIAVRVERPGVDEQPPGSGLTAEIEALADRTVVKRTIGGFYGTELNDLLEGFGVDTLVFGGIATNLGVESTARAATDHGYEVAFVEDALAALTAAEHHAATTLDLPRFGRVLPLPEIALEGS